jgi:hypothetical protein
MGTIAIPVRVTLRRSSAIEQGTVSANSRRLVLDGATSEVFQLIQPPDNP